MDTTVLDKIIFGRIKPHIYAFETKTVRSYLKVGDTYRPVEERLAEWREHYWDLEEKGRWSSIVEGHDDIYFRDHAVHSYLVNHGKKRLERGEIPDIPCYSREFFKDTNVEDVKNAIDDINNSYDKYDVYKFYNTDDKQEKDFHFARTGENWKLRKNQEDAVKNFYKAVEGGRTNLLMYAVMRFGKSFTALCCAQEKEIENIIERDIKLDIKLVVVISAKADVLIEWQKNVEQPKNFENFEFKTKKDLDDNHHLISNHLKNPQGKVIVLFLTFQELLGDEIKERHKELFENNIDLLIVDETHFGARAEQFSKVLADKKYKKDVEIENLDEDGYDFIENKDANKQIAKVLKPRITLHLSGTPYRILMGKEFEKEDIIAFCQYSDIIDEQEKWREEYSADISSGSKQEWENPYYGFPKMIRFAFHPSKAAQKKLKEFEDKGSSYAFSKLFEPKSTIKDKKNGDHKKFKHEKEILELFQVIDGKKSDKNVLSFLDYKKIKTGDMCRHIVCVLPYCAACDALEELIKNNKDKFVNLGQYEIINIAGHETKKECKTNAGVKEKIKQCEAKNIKTLTLTVKRMLTGSTVEQWDTMIYLNDTSSPQEYDQAIFRLQNQYVKTYKGKDENGNDAEFKYNMKPQTLLVDFDPHRMFVMQEERARIYNNVGEKGFEKIKDHIVKDLVASPIITLNSGKLSQVNTNDLIESIISYSANKGVMDELDDPKIVYDLSLIKYPDIKNVIDNLMPVGNGKGLISTEAYNGEEHDFDFPESDNNNEQVPTEGNIESKTGQNDANKELKRKFAMYYARILFFVFLSENDITSLGTLIEAIESNDSNNKRLAKSLELDVKILQKIFKYIASGALDSLDRKIYEINLLSKDEVVSPSKRIATAINRFNKLSESEVATPTDICKEMVDLIPDESFKKLKDSKVVMLDIASKHGEFAVAICDKCKELGIDISSIKDSILSIPTSAVAYEFTRKVYEILGLNTDCIAEKFTSYDLLQIKKVDKKGKETDEIDYQKISDIILQNKEFNTIELNATNVKEGDKMKVEAVVGNPPYQESKGKTENQTQGNSNWIYQYFQFAADNIGGCSCLIYPFGGWFDAPERLNGLGTKLLTDGRTISIKAYEGTTDKRAWYRNDKEPKPPFGINANLSAGVAIVLRNKNKHNSFKYSNRIYSDTIVDISFKDSIDLPPNPVFIKINKKLKGDKLRSGIYKGVFGIESDFVEKNPNKVSFSESDWKYPIQLLTNDKSGSSGRTKCYWTEQNNIPKGQQYLDYYKVIMTSAYPKQKLVLGKPTIENVKKRINELVEILPPKSAFGMSRLSLFMSKDKSECDNFVKYLNTNFFAGLVIQEPNRRSSFGYIIPMQDFTNNSDIKWNKPISEIDKQLYNKYGLSSDEIEFIEKK